MSILTKHITYSLITIMAYALMVQGAIAAPISSFELSGEW